MLNKLHPRSNWCSRLTVSRMVASVSASRRAASYSHLPSTLSAEQVVPENSADSTQRSVNAYSSPWDVDSKPSVKDLHSHQPTAPTAAMHVPLNVNTHNSRKCRKTPHGSSAPKYLGGIDDELKPHWYHRARLYNNFMQNYIQRAADR